MATNINTRDMEIPEFLRSKASSVEKKVSGEDRKIFNEQVKNPVANYYEPIKESQVSAFEKESLIDRIKGLTEDQLNVIIDHIPVDICLKRIERELNKNKEFMSSVQKAMYFANDR